MTRRSANPLAILGVAAGLLLGSQVGAAFATLFAAPGPAAGGANPPIILISVDTLRADHLGCYGYRRATTPNIDAIAKGGTLFSRISSQIPLTLPSHASLFTSNYPFATGIEDNGEELPSNSVTLATVLKARGYRTAAFVGGFVLDRRFGLSHGFDVYDSPFDLHREAGRDPGDIKRLGEDVVRAATAWLKDNSSQPTFLFLHLYDLHTPYNLPANRPRRTGETGYDSELRYVDGVLGTFWTFLREQGLLDKTLVVFTSDHGESLGEHREGTHGYFIYQSTVWVPLVIHWPHWPAGAGSFPQRVDEPAGLIDLAPTILQFAGAPRPPQFQGQSLLDLLKPGNSRARREVYSESLYAHYHFGCSALFSLRDGRYKYIQAPQPELYDLVDDPGEAHNLYRQKQAVALASRERLLSLRSRYGARSSGPAKPLDPDAVARLSSLGYVAVSASHSAPPETGADPKDRIDAYEEYGHAIRLASSNRLEESDAELERLLAKYPNLTDPRMTLGLNEQRRGDHQKAAQDFREVLKTAPLNPQAHFNLAVSCVVLHQLDDADKELQAALAISPNYTRAEDLLGTVFLQKQEYDKAQARFQRALAIDPDDFTAHYNLGSLEAVQKHWDLAERQLRAALQVDLHDPEAHNTLGSVYLEQGELSQASAEFAEAIRLYPKFASAHYNLGLVLQRQDKRALAADEFRRALADDPQFSPARAALDRLGSPAK